jgi:hypothetical protein
LLVEQDLASASEDAKDADVAVAHEGSVGDGG